MASEEYQEIKEIFFASLEFSDQAEREAFLTDKCTSENVRREVELLFAARAEASGFLKDVSAISVVQKSYQQAETNQIINQKFDKYRIESEIGRGGMGAVFLANREDFRQQVALKLIKRGMDSDAILERFHREREILAVLNHPFIARLIDGGTTDDNLPFFVMEYVEGVPVDEYCRKNHLPEKAVLEIFRKICEAVSFAHQKLVVHRDLKPSNILVTADGTPKLLDFGIAKLLNDPEANSTQTNQRVLTPAYASPEQIKGETVDTTSDVFSLGKILSEILQTENRKTNKQNLKTGIQNADTDLRAILETALRQEPARRYASVSEFSEDVRRHLEGLPVKARKDTFGYRASKFVKRNKISVFAAALVLLTLSGGIIATTREAYIARAERGKAERRFNEVRKLAHTFMFDYHDALSFVAGTTKLRQRMVKDALEYLDSLASEAGDDPALQKEIAEAYIKIGDVQGRNAAPNLGDTKGAVEGYRKAEAMLENMTVRDPQNAPARFDLSLSVERLGEMSSISGKPTEAIQYFRQALKILEELRAAAPTDLDVQGVVAFTHRMLGQALGVSSAANIGDRPGALEELQQAAAIYEAIPVEKMTPDSSRPFLGYLDKKRDLSSVYGELAEVTAALGDQAKAEEYQRKTITMLEAALSEEPDNAAVRRQLAINYGNLGTDLLNGGDASNALSLYQKAFAIEENLAAADENNIDAKKDLATGYRNLGKAFTATGDKKAAAENYQKAISIFENLVAKDQSNAFLRRNLAFTYLKMSQLLAGTGDVNGAINNAQKSVSICNELVAADSKNATAKNTLAQTYIQLGDCQALLAAKTNNSRPQQLENWREAKDWYQKSLDLWQEMKTQGTLSNADSDKLDEAAKKVSKCALLLQH